MKLKLGETIDLNIITGMDSLGHRLSPHIGQSFVRPGTDWKLRAILTMLTNHRQQLVRALYEA